MTLSHRPIIKKTHNLNIILKPDTQMNKTLHCAPVFCDIFLATDRRTLV